MKYNNQIDFFSSPNSKFIGFSDIRHPHFEVNNHSEVVFESIQQERRMCRRLSFSASNNVEAIVPFGNDFFQERLEECEQEDYSERQGQQYVQENSLMMDVHCRLHNQTERQPLTKLKEEGFLSVSDKMRMECEDVPQSDRRQDSIQCKTEFNQGEIYRTPKRKSEFFTARKFCESTAQKSTSRNNEKGLRRLSSLAYSIVSQSSTTTYKQVAQRLLSHLNFSSHDMEDEDGTQKSSMQNVKRRVYDSLNVLLALGVIKRVGSKIAKQKQRKPFTTDSSQDLERYNEMLGEYNERVKALEARKRTERELKEKLEVFRRTVERNKKMKMIGKGKMIKLPFLVFVSREEGQIQWAKKQGAQNGEKKKAVGKRAQAKESEKEKHRESEDLMVKVTFSSYPDSYGDLDFFKLLGPQQSGNQTSEPSNTNKQAEVAKVACLNSTKIEEFEYPIEQYQSMVGDNGSDGQMNLIDEVLGQD